MHQRGALHHPQHETIWNAITHIINETGLLPDPTAITHQLRTTGNLTHTSGLLAELITHPHANPTNLGLYTQTIREHAIRRTLITHGQQFLQQAETNPLDTLTNTIDNWYELGDTLTQKLTGATPTPAPTHTDLTWLLTGTPPTVNPPQFVKQTNGHALFYPARVNGIFGDPEAGKTWLAMIGIVEAITNHQRAAYIDVDHNGAHIITQRLTLLGANPHDLANPNLFQLHEPQDAQELTHTITQLTQWQPAYAVLDSLGEMLPMLGIKSVDNDELSTALRNIATRLANTGTCVVTVDHLPKATEARSSGFAIGGTAKKRAIDGSYIYADARTPPAPGHTGKITLRIEKDRPGLLREHARGKYLGTFTIDSTRPDTTITSIDNESPITNDGEFRPTGIMEKISRLLEDRDNANFREIKDAIPGKDTTLRAAIQTLLNEGHITTTPGPRNATKHRLLAIYREADDAIN